MVKFENFEIFESESKGKGLRAITHIDAGEEILHEEPLVYTLMNAKCRGLRCDYCFSEAEKLFKCSKCKFVSYCGRECQSGDWKIHKHECKCLVKVAPKQPPDICRLVSHLLFKYFTSNKKTSANPSEIEALTDNRGRVTNSRKEAFFTFSGVLFDYLKGCSFTDDADIYGLLCRISSNSFTITNSELNSLGTGLYKTSSFLNHSCDPNVVAIFNGTKIHIRTIKEVQEGEELFLSYINLLATTKHRQSELMDGYMFTCSCTKCNGNGFSDLMMLSMRCPQCTCLQSLDTQSERSCGCDKKCERNKSAMLKALDCMDSLEALYNSINVIPTPDQHKKLEQKIGKGRQLLGHCNIALLHAYEVGMDGCLDYSDWKGALEYGKKLEKLYLVYLTKNHPSIGLHYFKQGKLELQMENLREGISYFEKAMKILCISHGEKHELVVLLQQTLQSALIEVSSLEQFGHVDNMMKMEE